MAATLENSVRSIAAQFDLGRKRRTLNTRGIVFLVVAAAAPLTAMVGNLPLALARGNGLGLPGAFLAATLTLLCFSLGYAQMSRRIVNTGAFYTYVVMGLGRAAGVGAAFIAAMAYTCLTVGLAAAFGFFGRLVLHDLGIDVAWPIASLAGIAITGFMGYRSIDLSSRLLQVLLLAEIAILVFFDASVVASRGTLALPLASFAPANVFGPGFAIGLMFAFTCFIGFEAAALFGEESDDPTRSIPRATLISVVLIGVFYMATAWITIGAIGARAGASTGVDTGAAAAMAADKGGELLFVLIERYCGPPASQLAALLLCTSLLASYLALHNAAARYFFALGREKILPRVLGEFNPRRYAPSNASVAVSLISVCALGIFFLSDRDPYLVVLPTLIGLATLGVILLQAIASLAIVAYFRRHARTQVWSCLIAPALGAAGLVTAVVLVMRNFPTLTSVDDPLLNGLPAVYPVLGAVGVAYGLWLRHRRPLTYAGIGQVEHRAVVPVQTRQRPQYTDRYCIIGAGPAGLLAARALRLEGVPYDQYERHADVGGIWDLDNPGTPMYESAHFISSKFTSGFYGLPMPASFPDYPDNRQILSYIRDFADAFDLRRNIRFNTGVAKAVPIGEDAAGGWRVTLADGQVHDYRGVICATGVTWHPSTPEYPGMDQFQGEMRHTVTHRSAADLKGRRVLIIGCGNSGADIACDAARNADSAMLSVRRGYRFVPKHIFGVPTDVFIGGRLAPPKGVVVPADVSQLLDAVVGDLTRLGLPKPDHDALQSHPIMNTQVLHHLAHGDLRAKPDVQRFTPTGAVFTDGTEEAFDLVLFATGYNYKLPYLNEDWFEWKSGHPQLYLNIFHRRLQGLAVLGFVEFADAGYQRFDEMAQMVAMDAYIRQSGQFREEWTAMKAGHAPNLRGAMTYIDSPRHANYVDVTTYRQVLAEIRNRFGWFDVGHGTYDSLRRAGAEATAPLPG
jgi:amino acid transporter